MESRIVEDRFGKIAIPKERMWGVQTQRSLENFPIGIEKMPTELIHAYVLVKKAAAKTNTQLGKMDADKGNLIQSACDQILDGQWADEFPLSVWQTGSGTQTNMNMNEVISNIANQKFDQLSIHPNDDVNMGQSTNDTFPTAIHISAAIQIINQLLPSLEKTVETLGEMEKKYQDTIKLGRTHLQDATPISFGQEVSGWKKMISQNIKMIKQTIPTLLELPLGGTAVGTGLNTHPKFVKIAIQYISEWTSIPFKENSNKFHGLASKDAIVHSHGALNTLAVNLMKIGNDIRWLASGPRGGLGEITIPENEAGSSIMPGKVNPTQIEALTMICAQIMGNDTSITVAASQGNFELNTYMPLIAYNVLQSIRLLNDSVKSFNERCLKGLKVNNQKMTSTVNKSLALVTALSPYIGYEKASKIAQKANNENITLREAAIKTNLIDIEKFDKYVDPSKMI